MSKEHWWNDTEVKSNLNPLYVSEVSFFHLHFFTFMSKKNIFPMHVNFIVDVRNSKTPIIISHTLWKWQVSQ